MTRQQPHRSISRVDGPVKVTGAARYAADHDFTDLAYGHLVLSTIGAGTIRSMDVAAARRAPGTIAVFTPFDRPALHGPLPGLAPVLGENRLPLQDREVRYHGQIIGLVIARTFEQARHAATLIDVGYDARRPDASFADGIADARPVPEFPPVDILADGVRSIDEAIENSPVTAGGTYSQPPKHPNAMEPHAAVAVWQRGKLTLYSGTQGPAAHALEMATALGVDETDVHVVNPHVGGGFGGKATTWAPTMLAAAAARACKRPVKLVVTREQLYTVTGHRPAVSQKVVLGAGRDGALTAVKHEAVSSRSNSGTGLELPGRVTLKFYQSLNIHVSHRAVPLDIPTATIMRAPADEPGSFALESAMDELAYRLGMDPIDLRRRNDLSVSLENGKPFSSKHLDECYRVGAARFGWSRRKANPGAVRDGEWLVGMGMSMGVLQAASGAGPTAMRVRFHANGTASVAAATADLGTGMRTVLAAVAADGLGLPVERIRVAVGDSTLPVVPGPYSGYGAVGSGSTFNNAPAVQDAARAAQRALIRHATEEQRSPFHGMDPGEVRYEGGVLRARNLTVPFGRLLTLTRTPHEGVTEVTAPGPEQQQYAFASFAAHFCEVRVNRWTREPRVSRFTTVVDAGTIINAKTAASQITGGVIFGLGQALLEDTTFEPATGRMANANLADYLLPVNADVPAMDVHFLDHPDTKISSIGARGLGELGTIGAAAAVANAIYNATGKRIRDLPITCDKLLG
ncbi:xanthine dehydrogenase family protein molybdopterin-binding subunit [Actinomadura alba]|uniref:Xanthine dehydrogenase family protein molybdopterin-binding subunit n=1 Tax=Actinomadura alba TaxID=406431 RepID=A0ABR7LNJ7_9ACTN|nr:xanthine dehydrogenase family protein molybdopterin-binding subunit [Actinomadura alba]MBC6466248.1 xanthine dehydrogenase family protein molybdopterin-binding subunit [Actinomadura alba]